MPTAKTIWSRVRGIFAAEEKSVNVTAWLRGDESGGGAGFLSAGSAQQQSVWIYACVSAIAETLAQIPFRFSRGERRGEDILDTGDFVTLFERPHPMLTRFEFWEYVVGWLMLRGRCFVVGLDKSNRVINWSDRRRQRPWQLMVLSPDRFRKNCEGGYLVTWSYTAGYDEPFWSYDFLPEELIYLRLPGVANFYEGQNPLFVALLAAQTDYASAQFMKGLMQNNADQGLIVGTDQRLSEEQRVQIEAAVRNRKRMAGRADKPLILEGGLKVEKPAITNADLQFLENRKFSRQEICAVYRTPQEILGYTEDANRSVADAARLNFVEGRIIPLGERLEIAVDPVVKTFGEDLYGWFDADALPIMQAARRARYAGAVQAFSIGVPIEVCSQVFDLGLPDDLPHKGKSYLPFSLQEVGADKEVPGSGLQEQDEQSEQEEPAAAAIDSLLARLSPPTHNPQPTTHTCGAGADEYASAIAGSIRIKQGRLNKFFFEQRNRVLAALEKELDGSRANDFANDVDGSFSRRALENLLNLIQENKVLWQRLSPLLRNDLEFGVAQIGNELGIDDFAVSPTATINFLGKRENPIKAINHTTWDQLKGSLQDGLNEGETYTQLVDRVKTIYKDASQSRAESVALTETNIAVNSGRFEGMKEAGVAKKGWQTSNLAGVRATHLQAEKDYADGIPIDQDFIVGGERLKFPGDPNGSAANTINCRCFTFAILDDKGAGKGLLTFEEWTERGSVTRSKLELATTNGHE
jgi:HK97 family phage portal protein